MAPRNSLATPRNSKKLHNTSWVKFSIIPNIYRLPPLPPTSTAIDDWMFGRLAYLWCDFGSLLEKHLFLGRTLLLRLQGYQTCAGAGMVAPGLANAVLVQHSVFGCPTGPFHRFRWPTRKAFVLRTDAAFAAPGLPNVCWCRNAGSRASKRCAGAASGVGC